MYSKTAHEVALERLLQKLIEPRTGEIVLNIDDGDGGSYLHICAFCGAEGIDESSGHYDHCLKKVAKTLMDELS